MKNFIPYARQSIDENDIRRVTASLKSDIITRGPLVEEFECAIAQYCNARFAVAFNTGTTALKASCFAADVSTFDHIITSPNTFAATVTAGLGLGAKCLLSDIEFDTGNIDIQNIAPRINQNQSRGRDIIIPVHYSGIPVSIPKIEKMIKDPNTLIIEDAAHALGSIHPNGEKVGACSLSDMTMFSFHPAKTITTGEGGMITTNSEHLYNRLLLYRNNGIQRDPKFMKQDPGPWYYEVGEMTGNYNFTEFQAALGLSQLKKLESFILARRHLIHTYREQLKGAPHITMSDPKYDLQTAYHLCVVKIDFEAYGKTRAQVMRELKAQGIGTQVHYIPIYRHPFFTSLFGEQEEQFPQMEKFYSAQLSLPLYADLKETQVKQVCNTLLSVLNA